VVGGGYCCVAACLQRFIHASVTAVQVLPAVRAAMEATAQPLVVDGVATRCKVELTETTEAFVHRGTSRLLIHRLTKALVPAVFTRTLATAAAPVVRSTAAQITQDVAPLLARTLSSALAHALTRHPQADIMCDACRRHGVPIRANETAHGPLAAMTAVSMQGPYCGACERVQASDRMLDATVARDALTAAVAATKQQVDALRV